MGKIVSKAELAKILGKDEKTIFRMSKEGLPIKAQGQRGVRSKYDTEEVIDWLVKKSSNGKEMENARIRLTLAQANKAELEVMELEGSLIPIEHVQDLWADIVKRVRAKLLSLPSRMAPQVSQVKNGKEAERVLKKCVHEALNELTAYEPETNAKGNRGSKAKHK
jgi:phage terminase Nu1 subunit (DNA packaging protein)